MKKTIEQWVAELGSLTYRRGKLRDEIYSLPCESHQDVLNDLQEGVYVNKEVYPCWWRIDSPEEGEFAGDATGWCDNCIKRKPLREELRKITFNRGVALRAVLAIGRGLNENN